eukprot:1161348-Pelagomonas_calceolata.AAC.2
MAVPPAVQIMQAVCIATCKCLPSAQVRARVQTPDLPGPFPKRDFFGGWHVWWRQVPPIACCGCHTVMIWRNCKDRHLPEAGCRK